jgi:hypothetical protein
VSAVWKLSQTADVPTMKFSNATGKRSVPGRPVVWRRIRGEGPIGIVGQDDEPVAEGYVRLTGAERDVGAVDLQPRVEHSPETRALVAALHAKHFAPYRAPGHPHR